MDSELLNGFVKKAGFFIRKTLDASNEPTKGAGVFTVAESQMGALSVVLFQKEGGEPRIVDFTSRIHLGIASLVSRTHLRSTNPTIQADLDRAVLAIEKLAQASREGKVDLDWGIEQLHNFNFQRMPRFLHAQANSLLVQLKSATVEWEKSNTSEHQQTVFTP